MAGWVGVDLDGGLAKYDGAMGNAIGEPIKPMLAKVQDWVAAGREVRIFTARVSDASQLPAIRKWLITHGLGELAITNVKDFAMTELYDDKAMRVKRNTGHICGGCYRMKHRGE